jgi:hypothetical protein
VDLTLEEQAVRRDWEEAVLGSSGGSDYWVGVEGRCEEVCEQEIEAGRRLASRASVRTPPLIVRARNHRRSISSFPFIILATVLGPRLPL